MYTNESARRAGRRLMGLLGVVALASGGYAGLMQGFREWTTLVQFAIGVGGIAIFFWLYCPISDSSLPAAVASFFSLPWCRRLVVTAALVGVNYIVVKKPKSWDLTKDRIFTLSDQTTSVLKGLQAPS